MWLQQENIILMGVYKHASKGKINKCCHGLKYKVGMPNS